MEFLDSLDLDTINKKSHRVRSWYLYEQYKSLERSQLDAAQKLKDRSYQERILRQELSERRARRKLYDQFGLCQSESRLKKDTKSESTKTSVSASNDDFFESFCDLQEDEQVTQVTGTEFSDDTFSHDVLSTTKCCSDDFNTTSKCCIDNINATAKCCTEDFNNVDDHKDDNCSYTGSINSVVENLKPALDDFLEAKEMEFVPNAIAEDIHMQLDSVKDDIQYLEKLAKLEDEDKISEDECFNADDIHESDNVVHEKNEQEYNNNIIAIWSRLVSFAYQVVQLNHGNCYCDYSSQLLTAVLACDVLRRGVNRMCNILQPYVSPIKFATDEPDVSNESVENVKRKKLVQSRKCRKICRKLPLSTKKAKTWTKIRYSDTKYSENCWQPSCKRSFDNQSKTNKIRRASEPWRSVAKLYTPREYSQTSSSSSSIWPDFLNDKPSKSSRKHHLCCCYHNEAVNPMLKIAKYIDSILMDIDDSKHM